MTKALIIVESPAKIKTLKKFLNSDFSFESSLGHVRDLPEKGFGIDIEHDFEPHYEVLGEKKEVISRLKKAAQKVDVVYLSPDPDREGEAIAWHIAHVLPKNVPVQRVTFNAITKHAVLEALKHPRPIDQALVDAQQARRLLDRIVGYKISPILIRRVQGAREGGLSAGRVQSVALKLVVDREKEIAAFIPIEYWNLGALLQNKAQDAPFRAFLHAVEGKVVEKEPKEGKEVTIIDNQQKAEEIAARLKKAHYQIDSVERKEKKRHPVPPFITSTLQQEASRHYGFSATRTMSIAQGLYEGVELGHEGAEGLITYMRTDSVRLAPEAIHAAREFIHKTYGKEYLPAEGRQFSSKKSAQDAHEAIRPTNLHYPPEKIKDHLSADQYKLYQLIWRRFIASQMNPAIYDTVTCEIMTDNGLHLRATGSTLKFRGFLAVYEEKQDHLEEGEENTPLPHLHVGEPLTLLEPYSEQAFTRPPPRFTEASLIKELEKSGIGRPSTYATIMTKIQSRAYTVKEKGTLKPTELGKVIAQMLEDNFKMIMDIHFTAHMEDDLENIAENKRNWKDLIRHFWHEFIPSIETAEKEAFVPKLATDIDCPSCGKHKLQKIWSRNSYFYGCSNYPECKFSASQEALNFKKEDYDPHFDWNQSCPECQKPMQMRYGKFGPFLGCSQYPKCHGIVSIPKPGEPSAEEHPACPAIGCQGKLTLKRSRFGKPFYSCTQFPECDVIVNHLEDLQTKYQDHPKTAYQKKAPKRGAARGSKTLTKTVTKKAAPKKAVKKSKKTASKEQKSYQLSSALQGIVSAQSLDRPTVIKKVWEYIKAHNCQDPKNKRMIVPDSKLAKVLGGSSPIDMMKLSGLLTPHLQ